MWYKSFNEQMRIYDEGDYNLARLKRKNNKEVNKNLGWFLLKIVIFVNVVYFIYYCLTLIF